MLHLLKVHWKPRSGTLPPQLDPLSLPMLLLVLLLSRHLLLSAAPCKTELLGAAETGLGGLSAVLLPVVCGHRSKGRNTDPQRKRW